MNQRIQSYILCLLLAQSLSFSSVCAETLKTKNALKEKPRTGAATTERAFPKGYTVSKKSDGFLIVDGPEGTGVFTSTGRELIAPKHNEVRYVGEKLFVVMDFRQDATQQHCLMDSTGKIVSSLPDWT